VESLNGAHFCPESLERALECGIDAVHDTTNELRIRKRSPEPAQGLDQAQCLRKVFWVVLGYASENNIPAMAGWDHLSFSNEKFDLSNPAMARPRS
jgi:hypothetical protein